MPHTSLPNAMDKRWPSHAEGSVAHPKMSIEPNVSRDSVVILAKTGRRASWYQLTVDERRTAERKHVNMMLSIATRHRMRRLEGFRLIGPQGRWERFWVMEFPDLEGTEAWIEAEMAPPYGLHGLYEYYLARRLSPSFFQDWLPGPPHVIEPQGNDPVVIPELNADRSSVVVVQFSRTATASDGIGDADYTTELQLVAREYNMLKIEALQLINPIEAWHRCWICEFPDLNGAEAWIDAEVAPPRAAQSERNSYLARRWAPTYFAAWAPG